MKRPVIVPAKHKEKTAGIWVIWHLMGNFRTRTPESRLGKQPPIESAEPMPEPDIARPGK
jgi:hypothetical protein